VTTTPLPIELGCLAVHAREVDASARGRFAVHARAEWTAFVVETCHRVEWYGKDPNAFDRLAARLPAGGHVLRGVDAARHAISVAAGLDSIVAGEDQILHQIRTAVAAGRAAGALDPYLDRLFALALRTGRTARSWRQGPPRSLADVAVEAIAERHDGLDGRRVLVVGAGVIGSLAARAARAAGADVTVANRTPARALELAGGLDAEVAPLDPGPATTGLAGVVVAIRDRWIIGEAAASGLASGDAIVVDLSSPPAVGPDIRWRLDGRFLSGDDLARLGLPGSSPVPDRLVALVDAAVAEFGMWVRRQDGRNAARALAERIEQERRAELAELWRRLPDLEPESKAAIERMSRHLAERLLRDPFERLGGDTDGHHERAVRELWAL
jgi:glutamyl-tRNA reductase